MATLLDLKRANSARKNESGYPLFTHINERMVYAYGTVYVVPEVFIARCRSMGVDEQTLKLYGSKNIEMEDRIKRGKLAECVLQDILGNPYILLAKKKMSCDYFFRVFGAYNPMACIRLDRDFVHNKLLVNKFKLTHSDAYNQIIAAYNETLYLK